VTEAFFGLIEAFGKVIECFRKVNQGKKMLLPRVSPVNTAAWLKAEGRSDRWFVWYRDI
jgi:hypothetical protein